MESVDRPAHGERRTSSRGRWRRRAAKDLPGEQRGRRSSGIGQRRRTRIDSAPTRGGRGVLLHRATGFPAAGRKRSCRCDGGVRPFPRAHGRRRPGCLKPVSGDGSGLSRATAGRGPACSSRDAGSGDNRHLAPKHNGRPAAGCCSGNLSAPRYGSAQHQHQRQPAADHHSGEPVSGWRGIGPAPHPGGGPAGDGHRGRCRVVRGQAASRRFWGGAAAPVWCCRSARSGWC